MHFSIAFGMNFRHGRVRKQSLVQEGDKAMNREIENYLTILATMADELRHPNPSKIILESCRTFLTESPLPFAMLDTGRATVQIWGRA